ncbi:hypothetical protein L210DRAFT_2034007 [Boletus edulis BED1]|uniref:Uncharacterized protein n=1 Tax=Boletus edulis BED1 TaxID=1328754 RepID=A0AAD4C8Q8_BOLED|nr:hypothetical protein L210DRAFT_2034007 [Boletus edulis BED1]
MFNITYSKFVVVGSVCLTGFAAGALTPSTISMDHSVPSSSVTIVLISREYALSVCDFKMCPVGSVFLSVVSA